MEEGEMMGAHEAAARYHTAKLQLMWSKRRLEIAIAADGNPEAPLVVQYLGDRTPQDLAYRITNEREHIKNFEAAAKTWLAAMPEAWQQAIEVCV